MLSFIVGAIMFLIVMAFLNWVMLFTEALFYKIMGR